MLARAFTIVELAIVVAVIGILTALAVPKLADYQKRSKEAEAPPNVSGIVDATVAYHASYGAWPTSGNGFAPSLYAPAAALGKSKRPWSGPEAEAFTATLGFEPDGHVYGTYTTWPVYPGSPYEGGVAIIPCTEFMGCTGGDGMCVSGYTDVDADGIYNGTFFDTRAGALIQRDCGPSMVVED